MPIESFLFGSCGRHDREWEEKCWQGGETKEKMAGEAFSVRVWVLNKCVLVFHATCPCILLKASTLQKNRPTKGNKKRKGKKGGKQHSSTCAARPSIILASLHTSTIGEEVTGRFSGGPEYGPVPDSAESYRPLPDSEDQYADSIGSYNHFMDFREGYADNGEYGECSDVSLRSDGEFDYGEDRSMEVEEVLYGDSSNGNDVASVDSESDEAPARQILSKAPPRKCCSDLLNAIIIDITKSATSLIHNVQHRSWWQEGSGIANLLSRRLTSYQP
ncbi:hypothetical protein P4O66_004361 [Electrophorus voltai]|uniref:Uncharacterized protein n=1 Tax=Electrophorus voltai TaxID=2609070 RepID=A0AAD8ZNE3_9TELE|nr:hypothetical protein P4O66_004361 [Electrophorus voltai]